MTENNTEKSERLPAIPADPPAEGNRTPAKERDTPNRTFGYLLDGSMLMFFLYYCHKLYSFLGQTHFWSDENSHAYVSSVISKTWRIPFVLPDQVYGMREFSYPPLFHIFTAFAMSVAGPDALKYFNLVLLFFFLLTSYALIKKYYSNYDASISCLLLATSSVVAVCSIRFITEMLSMVLIFFSFFFLLLALRTSDRKIAVVAGLSTGLLLLSKQLGLVVLGFNIGLLGWFFLRKSEHTKTMFVVVGLSSGIYLAYLIFAFHNGVDVFRFLSVLSGNAAEKPQWAIEAVTSFRKYDSSLMEFIHCFYDGNGTVQRNGLLLSLSFIFPLYYFIETRSKEWPHYYALIMLICLAGAMVLWHITNARHTITLLPLLTFLAGYSFTRIAGRHLTKVAIFLLFVVGVHTVQHMRDYRKLHNAPKNFMAVVEALKADDSSEGRVLGLHSFDVLMYANKPVIWPHPALRDIPVDLVEKQTTKDFYERLVRYNIKYLLIDNGFAGGNTFNGRNYPRHFLQNCQTLIVAEKLARIKSLGRYSLIKVK